MFAVINAQPNLGNALVSNTWGLLNGYFSCRATLPKSLEDFLDACKRLSLPREAVKNLGGIVEVKIVITA